MVWTNPITWVLGQVLTAAQMNEQLRDNLQYLYDNRSIGVPGLVHDFAGSVAPAGYLMCDGSAVSRTTYAGLFQAIGTTWGVGDNSSTFNLPDLRGRVAVGAGQGAGLTNRALAGTGGEETHVLSSAELTSHNHTVSDPQHNHSQNAHAHTANPHSHDLNVQTTNFGGGSTNIVIPVSGIQLAGTYSQTVGIQNATASNNGAGTGVSVQSTGSSTAHNVMQPYRVLNKIIKT